MSKIAVREAIAAALAEETSFVYCYLCTERLLDLVKYLVEFCGVDFYGIKAFRVIVGFDTSKQSTYSTEHFSVADLVYAYEQHQYSKADSNHTKYFLKPYSTSP